VSNPGPHEPQETRDHTDRLAILAEQVDPMGTVLATLVQHPHEHLQIRPRSMLNPSNPDVGGAREAIGVHVTTNTCVSSDYRTRTLRTALDQTIAGAAGTAGGQR
jgi:hypothetical protein